MSQSTSEIGTIKSSKTKFGNKSKEKIGGNN